MDNTPLLYRTSAPGISPRVDPTGSALPQLFSGDLRPYSGISDGWSQDKLSRAEGVLSTLRLALPDRELVPDPAADPEDFWEDAYRLVSAYVACGGNMQLGTRKLTWSHDELARRFGPVSWDEIGGRHARDSLIAHHFVMKHGGREMALVTLNGGEGGPSPDTIVDWIIARHRAGVDKVVVKNAQNKSGIWVIPTAADPDEVRTSIMRKLEWTSVMLDGLEDALLVQDMLDLQYELRCFAVDGQVVTAAGNIEEFTPLDHQPATGLSGSVALDTRLRQYRGHLTDGGPSEVLDRPDLAIRLLKFGQAVATEYAGTVVVNVALDASTGQPVVVELNELPNSGLFASDPFKMAEGLLTAKDRGYPHAIRG